MSLVDSVVIRVQSPTLVFSLIPVDRLDMSMVTFLPWSPRVCIHARRHGCCQSNYQDIYCRDEDK